MLNWISENFTELGAYSEQVCQLSQCTFSCKMLGSCQLVVGNSSKVFDFTLIAPNTLFWRCMYMCNESMCWGGGGLVSKLQRQRFADRGSSCGSRRYALPVTLHVIAGQPDNC